jgi:hypothetical protein
MVRYKIIGGFNVCFHKRRRPFTRAIVKRFDAHYECLVLPFKLLLPLRICVRGGKFESLW